MPSGPSCCQLGRSCAAPKDSRELGDIRYRHCTALASASLNRHYLGACCLGGLGLGWSSCCRKMDMYLAFGPGRCRKTNAPTGNINCGPSILDSSPRYTAENSWKQLALPEVQLRFHHSVPLLLNWKDRNRHTPGVVGESQNGFGVCSLALTPARATKP